LNFEWAGHQLQFTSCGADEFGLAAGTNAAIIACHRAGSVTSTTLMVNMEGAEEAAVLVVANPGLGVGLHFTLTLGSPVCAPDQVTSLVDGGGRFRDRGQVEKRAITGRIKPEEIGRELRAQMSRMKEFGLLPTHIDSHQHVHLLPGVFPVVARFCAEHDLPLRIPWVWPHAAKLTIKKRLRRWLLQRLISHHMARWGDLLRTNQGLVSVFDLGLDPEEISLDDYRRILQQNSATPLELMVHPARVDADHREMTRISAVSEQE
jgi:predicted glycoside hydrolase/deacetylase ChbG (UPF0249 family)